MKLLLYPINSVEIMEIAAKFRLLAKNTPPDQLLGAFETQLKLEIERLQLQKVVEVEEEKDARSGNL